MHYPFCVLVVEDDSLIRIALTDFLLDEGFETIEAVNADEAVLLLEQRSDIGMMVTDVDMPGSMDGLMLAAAVSDRWPPVRIIVTSGLRAAETSNLPVGSKFFSKPYNYGAIASSIRDLTH